MKVLGTAGPAGRHGEEVANDPVGIKDMDAENMDIYDKVRNGFYQTKLPYPDRVRKPEILNRRVSDLTNEEIASIPSVKAEYDKAIQAHDQAMQAHDEDQGRLYEQFRVDIEAEHGMTGHPKASKLYAKAYERGHSGGLSEILGAYADLVDLVRD